MFITVIQFLLSLSILVVLHELGHFSAAKFFKTRVEKFYLFFNPGFALFKKQIGETEYGVGWLPLGGYVKISGMIDESFDTEQMDSEPQPWEFRSKPAWQRLIIMVGGVFVNFVLGWFLYSMILLVWGQDYIPNSSLPYGVAVGELGYELGLRDGDEIIKVGDKPFDKFHSGMITKEVVINEVNEITVRRNGSEQVIMVDPEAKKKLTQYEYRNEILIHPRVPYQIAEVTPDSPGARAGISKGDGIISVNGEPTPWSHQFLKTMATLEGGRTITVGIKRGEAFRDLSIDLDENGRIGILPQSLDKYVTVQKEKFSFNEAVPKGYNKSVTFISDQIKAFGQMFSGKIKAKDSLGSFISIGKMFGTNWDWERFWNMTASLSLLLGFLNLMPIPALDGGYVMFLLFESITGVKVPDRVMEIATMAGFFLLITLMVYALGLDISRLF